TLGQLPAVGQGHGLHIETVVREDAITLFGFGDVIERDMFRLLTSVQGVGAKVGLAILSVLEPGELQNAIAAQDKTAVSRANGVGPKLAARIVNEPKDKVTGLALQPKGAQIPTAGAGGENTVSTSNSEIEDAVSALVNLGYRPTDAHGAAVRAANELGNSANVESIVPLALKELSSV
ncbi:MAG: Holliday junction branch migration protein RuvA, partial [Cellvibrionaceae bacterium]|nr:Holliday junction branch migration protein RuvA [Cellvibrionaceae bacterium]